jgi:hypothetical protein
LRNCVVYLLGQREFIPLTRALKLGKILTKSCGVFCPVEEASS